MSSKKKDMKAEVKEESTEKELMEETENGSENETGEVSEQEEVVDEQTELEKVKAENTALNDKFLRLYSEFENFRRRTAKEKVEMINNAGGQTIEKFLPVLDDLDRASQNNQQATDIESVKAGFELIEHKMRHILETMGVKAMDAKGKDFDPDYHEAITKIPAPEEDLKGKVVDVIEAGYFINDKVLRYAKVVVGE